MSVVGKRRKSRELAMQMLFQADIGKQTPDQVRATFWKAGDKVEPEVRGFAEDLFRAAITHQEAIDELIVQNSKHWRLERMAAVDRNVLRLGCHELRDGAGTPAAVVLEEIDGDDVVVRVRATPERAEDNAVLADEIIAALASVTREHTVVSESASDDHP